MKQIYSLLTILSLSFVNAQVFTENFDSGVPGNLIEDTINGNLSWQDCGGDTGGLDCTGAATFYHTSFSAYNTALMTPVLDLSSGVYKVNYTLAKREKDDRNNQFFVEISTDGGENWVTMKEQHEAITDPVENSIVISAYNPTSTTSIRFRGRNQGGYSIVLDNISISEVTGDDAAVVNLDLPSLIVAGDIEIKGTVSNLGINPITSFDLNWQVDGGEVHTQNYNGQNITSGQNFNFTHADIWAATGGEHNVNVWVSNTNVTDSDSSNDTMSKDIMVASGSAYKVPMYEKFSSSTCPPCYSFNTNAFNPFFSSYGHDKATLISYQVWWPGAGDPYSGTSGSPVRQEIQTRVNYYGVNAAPTLLLNTEEGTFSSSTLLQNALDDMIATDNVSFFKIDADHTINGNDITVTMDVTPYISGNYNLQVIVIEKTTTGNVATNGETEFHNVFMKGLPSTAGTALSLVQDEVQHLEFTHDMSDTFVEEMDDLAVVVFLQDNVTKEIMQSTYTDASGIVLGTDEMSKSHIVLVPNPTSGIVKIISENDVDVQIFDLSGKNVYNQSAVANDTTLNLSGLGKGIFIVNMIDKDGVTTVKKLVIK